MRLRIATSLALCARRPQHPHHYRRGVVCRALSSGLSSGLADVGVDVDVSDVSAAAAARNADPSAVFVVLGASRGIGAEFAKQLLDRTAGSVVACCRRPEDAAELVASSSRLTALALDVRDATSLENLARDLPRVDCLINCIGVLHAENRMPERKLSDVDPQWLSESFEINCASALFVTQALAGALKRGKGDVPSVVAHLSARVGSISDNRLGGWYSYRISKAALNMATRTSAIELKRQRTICVSLHPGTTKTGLSEPFQKRVQPEKLFEPSYTVTSLLSVIDNLNLENHTGGFFAYDGTAIPY